MNCRRVMNLLSAYVDGELTGAEMLEIRRHLSNCEECMKECESLQITKQMVARLRNVAPREDFAAAIMMRLDEVSIPPYQKFINSICVFTRRKLSPVAAALTASGVALAILSAGGGDGIRTENAAVVASSPLNLNTQSVSFMPKVPDPPIMYSESRPLVIANQTKNTTFQFASFSTE